jgi:hypothetical protein
VVVVTGVSATGDQEVAVVDIGVGLLPAPAGMGLGDLARTVAELGLAVSGRAPAGPMGGAVPAHEGTGPSFGDPKRTVRATTARRRRSGVIKTFRRPAPSGAPCPRPSSPAH